MSQNTGKKSLGFHLIFWLGSVCLLLLDQWTKYLACIHLKDRIPVSVIEDVFCLQYLENRGAAFGIMQNRQFFFVVIAALILGIIGYLYSRMPYTSHYRMLRICAVLIASGAVGNMIDRIRLNYVVDFFYFSLIDFPVFNVADCYVVIACIWFACLILFYYKDESDFDFLKASKRKGNI